MLKKKSHHFRSVDQFFFHQEGQPFKNNDKANFTIIVVLIPLYLISHIQFNLWIFHQCQGGNYDGITHPVQLGYFLGDQDILIPAGVPWTLKRRRELSTWSCLPSLYKFWVLYFVTRIFAPLSIYKLKNITCSSKSFFSLFFQKRSCLSYQTIQSGDAQDAITTEELGGTTWGTPLLCAQALEVLELLHFSAPNVKPLNLKLTRPWWPRTTTAVHHNLLKMRILIQVLICKV